MSSQVQRWGNSLAVRIPKVLAEQVGLQANDEVEIQVQSGQIILTPIRKLSFSLDELLAGITPENLPGEWDMGDGVGNEAW